MRLRCQSFVVGLLLVLIAAPVAVTAEQAALRSTANGSTSVPALVQPRPPQPNTGFAYDLQMAGTLIITEPGSRQEQHIALLAGLELRWDAKVTDGHYPAQISLVAPHLSVGGKEKPFDLERDMLAATFNPDKQLLWVQTPVALSALGIDLTHVLLGLTVPYTAGPVIPGMTWDSTAVVGAPGSGTAFDLKATYTLVRFEERRGQFYALARGSISLKPKDFPTRASYVGRVEAYVDPNTGRVVESATSLDIQSKVQLPTATPGITDEASIRTVLTTYLLDLGPASNRPAAQAPKESEPKKPEPVPVPIVIVGQKSSAVEEKTPDASPPEPEEPTTEAIASGPLFIDPAGRFSLTLPPGWQARPDALSADATLFAGPLAGQRMCVYVDRAGTPSIGDFARSAIDSYAKRTERFRLHSDLRSTTIGDVPALIANYTYPVATSGEPVSEIALFARYQGHNYVLQYGDIPKRLEDRETWFTDYLSNALRFGPTPGGPVPASVLAEAETRVYVDPQQRFGLSIPAFWPLFSVAEDGTSVTFAEIGKNGFLTVYAQDEMEPHTADTVMKAWRGQWGRQEKEFRALTEVASATLDRLSGSGFSYQWKNADGRTWQRELTSVVYEGMLYAVVIDYVAGGALERNEIFQGIINSFRIPIPQSSSPESTDPLPVPLTDTPAQQPPLVAVPQQPSLTGDGALSLASRVQLDEPLAENRILLVGRLGQRQGESVQWLRGITVRIRAGQSLYATRTDSQGYFAFANVAPLNHGAYLLVEAEGPMLGYAETVTATFSGIPMFPSGDRLVNTGYVILELLGEGRVRVGLIPPRNLEDPNELQRYFLGKYPGSGWSAVLQRAVSHP